MSFASKEDGATPAKAWRDIWGCGQGIGAVREVVTTAALVDRLEREYRQAREVL
jgi:nitronate monooxygenase